jgi:hypothetical protein
LRADGARRIWLAAPSDSTLPARQFYRALGWRQTGEERSTDEVILELPLDNGGDRTAANPE